MEVVENLLLALPAPLAQSARTQVCERSSRRERR